MSVGPVAGAGHDHLASRLRAAGLGALTDLGFTGLDPDPEDPVIITGWKSTRTSKTTPQRQANQALSGARAPVEHGFSDLKHWHSLTRLRTDPGKTTILLRSARPHRPAHHPLTDDHELCPAAPSSTSTANPAQTRPLTSQFRLERPQSDHQGAVGDPAAVVA